MGWQRAVSSKLHYALIVMDKRRGCVVLELGLESHAAEPSKYQRAARQGTQGVNYTMLPGCLAYLSMELHQTLSVSFLLLGWEKQSMKEVWWHLKWRFWILNVYVFGENLKFSGVPLRRFVMLMYMCAMPYDKLRIFLSALKGPRVGDVCICVSCAICVMTLRDVITAQPVL